VQSGIKAMNIKLSVGNPYSKGRHGDDTPKWVSNIANGY